MVVVAAHQRDRGLVTQVSADDRGDDGRLLGRDSAETKAIETKAIEAACAGQPTQTDPDFRR